MPNSCELGPLAGDVHDDGNNVDADACSNTCNPASCFDKLKNAAETGGGLCNKCVTGKMCKVDSDCTVTLCTQGMCTAPTLTLPNCAAANVTAVQVWAAIGNPKCGCHVLGSGGLQMSSAADLKSKTVNVASTMAIRPAGGQLDGGARPQRANTIGLGRVRKVRI